MNVEELRHHHFPMGKETEGCKACELRREGRNMMAAMKASSQVDEGRVPVMGAWYRLTGEGSLDRIQTVLLRKGFERVAVRGALVELTEEQHQSLGEWLRESGYEVVRV